MHRTAWTSLALFGLLAVGAVLLAACGGDDNGASSSGAGTPRTASGTPKATATANAGAASDAASVLRSLAVPRELAAGMTLGKADAKVTLTVFEDFQCPFCLRYTTTQESMILEEYVKTGKVKLEFKNFPILGQESVQAAVAAQCAADQGRFWEFHRKLFLVQAEAGQLSSEKLNVGRFSNENLRAYAVEAGADGATFDTCYTSQDAVDRVTADYRQGKTAGIAGTPGFLINGKAQPGTPATLDAWRKLLNDALK